MLMSECKYWNNEHKECSISNNTYEQGIADERKRIIAELEERFSWLNKATKYGNADAEQQNFSYSTIMMYEVADLINEALEIVRGEKNE